MLLKAPCRSRIQRAALEYKLFIGSSAYLSSLLRPLFNDTIPQQHRYESVFDRFEYLFAMIQADSYEKRTDDKKIWRLII
jgi:hypothetical protein